MFGDKNTTQDQPVQDNQAATTNNDTPTPVTTPPTDLPSFTMDPAASNGASTTPEPAGAPTTDEPQQTTENEAPSANDSPADSSNPPSANGDLMGIKQQALSQLTPIVSHLDQTPEEKFKTLMMMIQASDDQSLIKQAYETIQQIPDEKTKAQALLDIVNEINYFTQQSADN